jgi:hypothetical protein
LSSPLLQSCDATARRSLPHMLSIRLGAIRDSRRMRALLTSTRDSPYTWYTTTHVTTYDPMHAFSILQTRMFVCCVAQTQILRSECCVEGATGENCDTIIPITSMNTSGSARRALPWGSVRSPAGLRAAIAHALLERSIVIGERHERPWMSARRALPWRSVRSSAGLQATISHTF